MKSTSKDGQAAAIRERDSSKAMRFKSDSCSSSSSLAMHDAEKARQLLQLIISDPHIFDSILEHLYRDIVVEIQRGPAQAFLRQLTLVEKAWIQPASSRLYRSPYLGTATRAESLAECLEMYPERARLVKKLIFGEGSSADVKDWKDPLTVPRIINASQKLEIIGFDGLTGVDLEAFKHALVTAPCLEEIRSCGAAISVK